MKKRLLAIILTLLFLAGCGAPAGLSATPAPIATPTPTAAAALFAPIPGLDTGLNYFTNAPERDDLHFNELNYEPAEDGRVAQLCTAISEFTRNGGDAGEFAELELELYWTLYYAYTMYALAEIAYYQNPTDAEAAGRYQTAYEAYYDASELYWRTLHELALSPYSELLYAAEYQDWQIAQLRSYDPGEHDAEATAEEARLVQDYYTLSAEPDPDARALSELFVKLVKLRREMAKTYGYPSYAAMAYDGYSRDYSPEDAAALYGAVKQYFVPLAVSYGEAVYDRAWELGNGVECSETDVLSAMERVLPLFSDEAGAAFQYMREYGLYDLAPSPDKAEIGFTTWLYYYGEPFIFNAPTGTVLDYTVTFHEFGHFLSFFYSYSDLIFGVADNDLSELQSQGMEILFTHYYADIFGEELGDALKKRTLMDMVFSVIDGAMYDEFLSLVYAEPDLTPERVSEIYLRLYDEYGYERYTGCEYEWQGISHNYDTPFYYLSYCVSALPALELFAILRENPANAVQTYMNIAAMNPEEWYFSEALAETGLGSPFEGENFKKTADALAAEFEG